QRRGRTKSATTIIRVQKEKPSPTKRAGSFSTTKTTSSSSTTSTSSPSLRRGSTRRSSEDSSSRSESGHDDVEGSSTAGWNGHDGEKGDEEEEEGGGGSFAVECPYERCGRTLGIKDCYSHIVGSHSNDANHEFVCALRTLLNGGTLNYQVKADTNLYNHVT